MFVSVHAVSQSIQAINAAVDAGDPAQTLAALRNPGAGLYGVTSECAQTYQNDLVKMKDERKAEGEEDFGEEESVRRVPASSCCSATLCPAASPSR